MMKCNVHTPIDALVYILDCQLATVSELASLKSRRKHDFERQCAIAQIALDWLIEFGADLSNSRGANVVFVGGKVSVWAEEYMPEKRV